MKILFKEIPEKMDLACQWILKFNGCKNNRLERLIHNVGFSKQKPKGATASATMYVMVEMAKSHEFNIYQYFVQTASRFSNYLFISRHNFESKSSTAVVKTTNSAMAPDAPFLPLRNVGRMGVIIQRHRDVGVSHDILQRLGIYACVC